MCGIVGIVDPAVSELRVDRALGQLQHRGPDSMGVFVEPELGVGLGHARLSIVDLETGQQPLFGGGEELVLVCNGEIYDFERIRESRSRAGYSFRTKSDSEVILALYDEHGLGPELFEQLRGEFAFLLLDRRRKKLIACRDRFGIKPLYLARVNERGWVFASEAKAIFATGLKRAEIDPRGFDDENGSLFVGVWNLPPATACVIDLEEGTHELLAYWKPELAKRGEEDRSRTAEEWKQETRRELDAAIRLRLRADVPVGVYLSGGIDSALVTALVGRMVSPPPHAFTVSFVDLPAAFDEAERARRVALSLGVQHHVLEVTREQLWSNLRECLWHCEQPLANLAPVAKYLLSDLAAGHVRVVLTGEGADEVFLGYELFERALRPGREGRAPGLLARLWSGVTRVLGAVASRLVFTTRRASTGPGPFASPSQDESQLENRHPVTVLQYRWLANQLRNIILVSYGDRTEMAHSIEGRVPFLDHRLFALARRMPIEVKIANGVEKHVLREVARGLVPDELLAAKKWSFSTPVPDMGGEDAAARELIAKHLSREAISRAGFVRHGGVVLVRLLRRLPPLRQACDGLLFRACCLQILFDLFEQPEAGE